MGGPRPWRGGGAGDKQAGKAREKHLQDFWETLQDFWKPLQDFWKTLQFPSVRLLLTYEFYPKLKYS
jgi:hypothetical protein